MVNLITTALSMALAAAPAALPEAKPLPPPPGGTIVVGFIPGIQRNDTGNPNGAKSNDMITPFLFSVNPAQQTPDERYAALKSKLDERFARMFEIKKEIDAVNDNINSKWEEYNALRQIYERQLKKIIAEWVTDMNYLETPNYSIK